MDSEVVVEEVVQRLSDSMKDNDSKIFLFLVRLVKSKRLLISEFLEVEDVKCFLIIEGGWIVSLESDNIYFRIIF